MMPQISPWRADQTSSEMFFFVKTASLYADSVQCLHVNPQQCVLGDLAHCAPLVHCTSGLAPLGLKSFCNRWLPPACICKRWHVSMFLSML